MWSLPCTVPFSNVSPAAPLIFVLIPFFIPTNSFISIVLCPCCHFIQWQLAGFLLVPPSFTHTHKFRVCHHHPQYHSLIQCTRVLKALSLTLINFVARFLLLTSSISTVNMGVNLNLPVSMLLVVVVDVVAFLK